MLKFICFITFILSSLGVYGQSKWQLQYNLVQKDIRSVEALKTKDIDLSVRLFELYGEKLNLLIERENEYKLNFLQKENDKAIRTVVIMQKKALAKLESIARNIERQSKDPDILSRINYYRALNLYITKDYSGFYKYIKLAERYNKDKNREIQINQKLADYHFNEKQYKESTFYYTKLTKIENKWLTKNYYNLAWSFLKLQEEGKALNAIKKAFYLERENKYFELGDQLVDGLLLFYAYSKKTREGIAFLKKYDLLNFDNLLKYVDYVYNSGEKKDVLYVFNEFKNIKMSLENRYVLVSKKIKIFRPGKMFKQIQEALGDLKLFFGQRKNEVIKKEVKENLITDVKGYTGFLQEIIKAEGFLKDKRKSLYIKYTAFNFNILKLIDPKNTLEYSFYEAETYFAVQNYKRASFTYAKGIANYKKDYPNEKKNKFLVKSFDGLFKSLEKQKKPSSKILLFSFTAYLDYYPRDSRSNVIHKRLLSFYKLRGDFDKVLETIISYNKYFPRMYKIQKGYYFEVLNSYINKKNVSGLEKLKKMAQKKFLGLDRKEVLKIDRVIVEIYFSKYEDLAKAGKYEEAIAGFHKLFLDKKSKYSLRIDSLRKEMFYLNKIKKFQELNNILKLSLGFYNSKMKIKYQEEFLFYSQSICSSPNIVICRDTYKEISDDKVLKLKPEQESFYLRIRLALGDDPSLVYQRNLPQAEKNLIFKYLLIKSKSLNHPLILEYNRYSDKRIIIKDIISKNIYRTFYQTFDFQIVDRKIKEIPISSLRKSLLHQFKKLKTMLGRLNFKLPEAPKKSEITEEEFGKYGSFVSTSTQSIIQLINSVIQQVHPNLLPYILSKSVQRFEAEVQKVKEFIPVSKNQELEQAMNVEMSNIKKFFDQQIVQYRSLYLKSIQNAEKAIGVGKYSNDVMSDAFDLKLNEEKLWVR